MIKTMKKFMSAYLTFLMLFTLCTSVTYGTLEDASVWTTRPKDGITARFAVMSDAHITEGETSRLSLALKSLTNIGGIDGIMMVGDMARMNEKDVIEPEVYSVLNGVLASYPEINAVPNAYVMGNHEYPSTTTDEAISAAAMQAFIEGIGLNESRTGVKEIRTEATEDGTAVTYADAVYEMAGYTVVAISPEAYSNQITPESEAWAKEKLLAAISENPEQPVFYLQHQPIQDTVRSSTTAGNSAEFAEWIKTQPNIINFTAHCHYSAWDPLSIWQSEQGFTAIHTPLLGNGTLTMTGTYEQTEVTASAAILMVEIDENNLVKVYKLDLYNGEEIGVPYVIDIDGDKLYTDARLENANTPEFKNGETVIVEAVGGDFVTISFPDTAVIEETVPNITQDGFVHHYRVDAINKATGNVDKTVRRYGDFWTKSGYDIRSVTLTDLKLSTDYTIQVTPLSPLNAKTDIGGAPISVDITTGALPGEPITSTKKLNVAMRKPVYSSGYPADYPLTNLVDDNRSTFTVPGSLSSIPEGYEGSTTQDASKNWFIIDLEKRYTIDSIEIYDRFNQADEGGRRALSIEASNSISFQDATKYDVLDSLPDGTQDTLFPDNGCFTAKGNGNAYRYIRIRRTGGYYYGYSEIKVWANQDVTEVTRNKPVTVSYQDSSTYAGSDAVNGTVTDAHDAWVANESSSYHFLTVDMELPQHIGLIEMIGRRNGGSDFDTRNNWYIYGSNQLAEKTALTTVATLPASTGYTALLCTRSFGNYLSGEYIFPPYPAKLQQVFSDKESYQYLTFKRSSAGSTYLGEARGFVLNPMVNRITEENDVIQIDFSDTMDEASLQDIRVYSGATGDEISSSVSLSENLYTAYITPETTAPLYQIFIGTDVKNLYGTGLAKGISYTTTITNYYSGFSAKKDIYTNVALGKPVTSTLSPYANYPVTYINDGLIGKSESINNKLGSVVGTGTGYIQIDLQNRYMLEKVEFFMRPNVSSGWGYLRNWKITAANNADFSDEKVLDSIDSNGDTTKLNGTDKIWSIPLDGTKDYRYLRLYKTSTAGGEWGVAELRAFAKFDGISLTKNATADSYYYLNKGGAGAYLPSNVLDGKTSTFHYVCNDVQKPTDKMTYLQLDLKRPYHVGYAELVARETGYSDTRFYQHFDILGSNVSEPVTEDNKDTHPYLNTVYLESADGYKKLYRTLNADSLNAQDSTWEKTAGATFGITMDDSTAYQYIIHKTNAHSTSVEMSEMRLFTIAQRVNSVTHKNGIVTISFAGEVLPETLTSETVKLYDAFGNKVSYTDATASNYSFSFKADIADGYKLIISKDVMNTKAVPMAEDYTYTFSYPAVTDVNFPEGDTISANTTYTFTANYNNYMATTKKVDVIIAVKNENQLIKSDIQSFDAPQGTTPISVSVTTGTIIDGQHIEVYVWENGTYAPLSKKFSYFKTE